MTTAETATNSKQSRRSAEWELIELRLRRPLPQLLEEGLAAGKSLKQLATEWGVSPLTVQKWARNLNYQIHWTAPDGRVLR